jgi:hypothetical protein
VSSWQFEETDADRSNVSGDVGRLVRNYEYANPGVLSVEPPTDGAALLAREAIQNSWDSALERMADQQEGSVPDFQLEFRFSRLVGREKIDFVESAGLGELAERATRIPDDRTAIANPASFDRLNDEHHPLQIMQLVEKGTTGMYGPFVGHRSKMSLAMVTVGFTAKRTGLGGSYGQGKAGLIRGSGARVVFGYSAFAKRADDEATRRLLGMTYWSSHSLDQRDFNGWARFAEAGKPFTDDEADSRAAMLGLQSRNARDPRELGSTFLAIDPTVEPTELVKAVERYWWPALESPLLKFDVTVVNYDGDELIPRPKTDPALHAFIKAYGLHHADKAGNDSRLGFLQAITLAGSGEKIGSPGSVSLVADTRPGGWSWPSQNDSEPDHKSLVALVRGPRMVVKYLDVGAASPFVRGVFVAGPEANDLLAATEPPLHDDWPTHRIAEEVPGDAYLLSKEVIARIRTQVGAFRRLLRPPSSWANRVTLREFDNVMKNLVGGQGGQRKKPVDPGEPPQVNSRFLELGPELASGSEERIRGRAKLRFVPAERVVEESPFPVRIRLSYRLVEDGRLGEPWGVVLDDVPGGFELVQEELGTLALYGNLGMEGIDVLLRSEPHDADWSGQFLREAERLEQPEAVGDV